MLHVHHNNPFSTAPAARPPHGPKPTSAVWDAYQAMFDFFNEQLWGGKLPEAILNMSRKRGAAGFFWADRWESVDGSKRAPEISLNPECSNRQPVEVASTLVHEMCHHWQQAFGRPGKGAYHNREWGTEMKRVGLQPVSHDQPGKETGCRVSHTVIADGSFLRAFDGLPEKAMPWRCGALRPASEPPLPPGGRRGNRNKTAYRCGCGVKVWGKPDLHLHCNDCGSDFQAMED